MLPDIKDYAMLNAALTVVAFLSSPPSLKHCHQSVMGYKQHNSYISQMLMLHVLPNL